MSERNKRKDFKEKPLYRKVNTTCHGGKMYHGNHDAYVRGRKETDKEKSKMKGGQQRHGLDFTPLYGFLRKNIGKNWDELHSKIKKRLPTDLRYDPLEYAVIPYEQYELLTDKEKETMGFTTNGESSYVSQCYVDKDGNLQLVSPNLTVSDFSVDCHCCTHTFNGVRIKGKPDYLQKKKDKV